MPPPPRRPRPTEGFDPRAVRCVGIVAALHKSRVAAAVREVAGWLAGRGVQGLLPAEQAAALSLPELAADPAELPAKADFLLAMGGDGTFLAAARAGAPHRKPILGVNLGGYGFLAAIPRSGMLKSLEQVMAGELRVEERMMLSARVLRGSEKVGECWALNDIVVGKGAFSRLFRLDTTISGELVSSFPLDGMIVATPTGATGYSLSAGGPVVAPSLRALIVTPICAHALSARTLVVPASEVIEVAVSDPRGEEVKLTADGQDSLVLRAGDRVEISEAEFSARVICPEGVSFYAKLRGKFGWVGRR